MRCSESTGQGAYQFQRPLLFIRHPTCLIRTQLNKKLLRLLMNDILRWMVHQWRLLLGNDRRPCRCAQRKNSRRDLHNATTEELNNEQRRIPCTNLKMRKYLYPLDRKISKEGRRETQLRQDSRKVRGSESYIRKGAIAAAGGVPSWTGSNYSKLQTGLAF